MTCWLPAVVSGVTALPEAAVDVTAGVEPGDPPALTAKIWNDGPPAGAGAHWKAQPIFHVPPAMVKAGLVQLPLCSVSGTSTVAGPTDAAPVVGVEPEVPAAPAVELAAAVVLVLLAAVVVGLEPAAAVVAVLPAWAVELLGGGNL